MTYERQSNSGITDVLQGVTLHLKETGSTSLQITSDTEQYRRLRQGPRHSFSGCHPEVTTKTAYDNQTSTFGLLAQSSALQGVSGELSQLLGSRINTGGAITSLYDLGLEFSAMAALP